MCICIRDLYRPFTLLVGSFSLIAVSSASSTRSLLSHTTACTHPTAGATGHVVSRAPSASQCHQQPHQHNSFGSMLPGQRLFKPGRPPPQAVETPAQPHTLLAELQLVCMGEGKLHPSAPFWEAARVGHMYTPESTYCVTPYASAISCSCAPKA
jgi:hypothetical protein